MNVPRSGSATCRGAVRLPLLLALVLTGAAALAPRGAEVFEFWYREILPRWVDATRAVGARVPFSLSQVSLLALVLLALALSWRGVRAARAEGARWTWPWALLRPWIAIALWVYVLAVLPWGVLHRRLPLEERRAWPALATSEVVNALRREAAALARSLESQGGAELAPRTEENEAQLSLRAAQCGLDAVRALDPAPPLEASGAREFFPRGALAALGIAGIFLPGWMEPHVEGALTPAERFFAIAHEEAHRAGFTSEAEANLAAYLGLARAAEGELREAALVGLLLHAEGPLLDPAHGPPIVLPARVLEAARAARRRAREQRWDAAARSAARVNDAYLRASGDRGGVRSYGVFPELLARARASGL
ncbi:MAG: DUF3810 family protein [Planctomycetes bacterium]|nr:DUF3810 family protein [Planctomycetota bacterium]